MHWPGQNDAACTIGQTNVVISLYLLRWERDSGEEAHLMRSQSQVDQSEPVEGAVPWLGHLHRPWRTLSQKKEKNTVEAKSQRCPALGGGVGWLALHSTIEQLGRCRRASAYHADVI